MNIEHSPYPLGTNILRSGRGLVAETVFSNSSVRCEPVDRPALAAQPPVEPTPRLLRSRRSLTSRNRLQAFRAEWKGARQRNWHSGDATFCEKRLENQNGKQLPRSRRFSPLNTSVRIARNVKGIIDSVERKRYLRGPAFDGERIYHFDRVVFDALTEEVLSFT